jgi:hypothetical protein
MGPQAACGATPLPMAPSTMSWRDLSTSRGDVGDHLASQLRAERQLIERAGDVVEKNPCRRKARLSGLLRLRGDARGAEGSSVRGG